MVGGRQECMMTSFFIAEGGSNVIMRSWGEYDVVHDRARCDGGRGG